jgi:hypothetical protein
MARAVLVHDVASTDPQLLASLKLECGAVVPAEVLQPAGGAGTVAAAWVRSTLASCLQKQNIIENAVKSGGAIDSENGFGYRPLHHAVLWGEASLLQAVLDAKPSLDAATTLGHNALHLAASAGSLGLVPVLVLAGVPADAKDRQGRTPADIACHMPWADDWAKRFGKRASEQCSSVWGVKGRPVLQLYVCFFVCLRPFVPRFSYQARARSLYQARAYSC